EHLLTFSQYKDAKTLFEAIQARFGGNDATKKTQRTLLRQMYENFNAPSTECLDSIFNRLQKIVISVVSTPVSIVSSHDNTTNLINATAYAFLANQPNGSQLVHKNLEQIHEGDLEEIDLKWQLALLSMRARRTRLGFTSYNVVTPLPTGLFTPPLIDLSNSGLEEFQHPEILDMDLRIVRVLCSDEDESEEMVFKSDNVQHKPEQANKPRKVSQNPRNNRTN
nr:hypothetical protein [Tanacetum cinerariifolium]